MTRRGRPLPVAPLIPVVALAALAGSTLGPVAGAMAGLLALLVVVALAMAVPGGTLRRERAARVSEEEAPRLHNLIGGLSRDMNLPMPELWVAPGPPNACALHLTKPMLCFRRELIDSFTRTELEAVGSFLLVALTTGAARRETLPSWAVPKGGPIDHFTLDVYAASVTRYPPALASALQRCHPAPPAAGVWLAGGDADNDEVETRAGALLDL